MSNGGVNHDCKKSGICFNDVHRLKFGIFDKCWVRYDWREGWVPATMRPSDVDFMMERKGNILIMEWKNSSKVFDLWSGQGRMFMKTARVSPSTIFLCNGSAIDMIVNEVMVIHRGYISDIMEVDQRGLKVLCWAWCRYADRNPVREAFTGDGVPDFVQRFLKDDGYREKNTRAHCSNNEMVNL